MEKIKTAIVIYLMLSTVSVLGQVNPEKLVSGSNVPSIVMEKLKSTLKDDDIESVVQKIVFNDKNKYVRYRFYLKDAKTFKDLNQITIIENGRVFLKAFRYEDTGNMPFEIIMKMQEVCGSEKVVKLAELVYANRIEYQAGCGSKKYRFNEKFEFIESEEF